jgi:EmrB/QacA subfamily drug resistance transporter
MKERAMTFPDASPLDEAGKRSIIAGVLLAMLLAALDQTIVSPALPTIGTKLGDFRYLPWVITGYLLTATAVTPLYGKLADIYGRRLVIFSSIGIFLIGSVVCAIAPSMIFLVLGRGVQGIGGGGLIALAMTVIGDIVPPRERGLYQGYISGVWATASLAGPTLGGFFSEHLHWSMIFWINLPLGFFAIWMISDPLRRLPHLNRQHRLDLFGSVLIVGATTLLLLVLTWGGSRFAWTSAQILGLSCGSLILWLLFAIRLLTCAEPLLPLEVLKNSVVRAATTSIFFAMAAFLGLSVYLPIFFERVLRLTSSQAGLSLVPMMIATVVGAAISGRMSVAVEHYKRIALIGLLGALVSLLILVGSVSGISYFPFEFLLVITGFGIGTLFPIATVSVQNAVELRNLGVATGVLTFLRSLGSAIGVAVLGAVVFGAGRTMASEPMKSVEAGFASQSDFGQAFVYVFLVAAIGLGVSLGCLFVMEERPLRRTSG